MKLSKRTSYRKTKHLTGNWKNKLPKRFKNTWARVKPKTVIIKKLSLWHKILKFFHDLF